MKLKTRFSILAFLIVVFAIVAPIIVFFALGYRWDSQTNRLVPTGTLLVASSPRDAEIYLNNKSSGHSTPATLRLIVPGEYEISLQKEGYEPWNRRATIFEKRITVARDNNRPVALFLQQRQPQLLASSTAALAQFNQLAAVPENEYVYSINAGILTRGNKNLTDSRVLADNLPEFTNYQILESTGGHLFILFDNSLYTHSENTLTLTATNITSGQWSSNGNYFTYYSQNTLWLYDATAGTYELITRTTANIEDIAYDTQTHHIIYAAGSEIHSTEADYNTSRSSLKILDANKPVLKLTLSRDGKTLYYLTEEEKLYSVLLR